MIQVSVNISKSGSGEVFLLEELGKNRWLQLVRATRFFLDKVSAAIRKSNPYPYNNPSKPGEPPRSRTGFLRDNLQADYDEANLTTRIGILENARYGLYLERGTSRMEARPFLRITLQKSEAQLKRFFQ